MVTIWRDGVVKTLAVGNARVANENRSGVRNNGRCLRLWGTSTTGIRSPWSGDSIGVQAMISREYLLSQYIAWSVYTHTSKYINTKSGKALGKVKFTLSHSNAERPSSGSSYTTADINIHIYIVSELADGDDSLTTCA